MLALIAGMGALPGVLLARMGQDFVICEMEGFAPDLPANLPRIRFRIEGLGTLLADLRALGVSRICMAGEVRRPDVVPELIDAATRPLIPRIMTAMGKGDDGTLRGIIAIFEEAGFQVIGAHEIAPDLLPAAGVMSRVAPDPPQRRDAVLGEQVLAEMGRADLGQACVIHQGRVVLREADAGTDAMLAGLSAPPGAILFKGPKPGQERRADLPTIGPQTAQGAAKAGLSGIVIEAGGVIALDLAQTLSILDARGMFLWIRPAGETA